jgi:hypothetical protein
MKRNRLLAAAIAAASLTAIAAPTAGAQAPGWQCTKAMHVTVAGHEFPRPGEQLKGNGCWTFDHPTPKANLPERCHFEESGNRAWAYDDTNWSHPDDDARIRDCAARHRGLMGYEHVTYRGGAFKIVRLDAVVKRYYLQLYTPTTSGYPLVTPGVKAKWLASFAADSRFAPMIHSGASSTNAAYDKVVADEVTSLCRMPSVKAIGLYVSAGRESDQRRRRDAIVKALNACTGRVVQTPVTPRPQVNRPPVAQHPQTFTLRRGTTARVPLNVSDPDGQPLTLQPILQSFASSSFGFSMVPGGFVMTVPKTAKGPLHFTYTATDPGGLKAQAHVVVNLVT